MRWRAPALVAALAVVSPNLSSAQQRCGGVERWGVKVGSDPAAPAISLASPCRWPSTRSSLSNGRNCRPTT